MRDEEGGHGPFPAFSVSMPNLRIFESVARHTSFSRAAEELHVSQPYVSNQILDLEAKLRVTLFRRVGRRVHLTESGVLLKPLACNLLKQAAAIEQKVADLREALVGRLDLATVVNAAEFVLPQALGEFRSRHPEVTLNLQIYNSNEVERAVADGRYELGVTLSHTPSGNLNIETLGLDELVVVVGKKHALASETTVQPGALAVEPMLVREPTSGTRLFIERRFSEAGIRLNHWLELNDNQVIKALVEANLGIAILSRRAVRAEVQAERLSALKIDGLALERPLSLVSRKQHTLSPPARTFRAVLMRFTSPNALGQGDH